MNISVSVSGRFLDHPSRNAIPKTKGINILKASGDTCQMPSENLFSSQMCSKILVLTQPVCLNTQPENSEYTNTHTHVHTHTEKKLQGSGLQF